MFSPLQRRLLEGAALVLLGALLARPGLATPLPAPGTHLFESDFLGSSSETYTTNGPRALVEGWTGERVGAHGGTSVPTSTVAGSIITYDGGSGNFSDNLIIENTLSGVPGAYLLQVRFRRDGTTSTSRSDFDVTVGGVNHFVDNAGHATGTSGATTSFTLTTGTWYILEVIDKRFAAPSDVQLIGRNFDAPPRSVDWIFMDAAPATGANVYEMRVWADGDARPSSPLVAIVPAPPAWLLLGTAVAGLLARSGRRTGSPSP